MFQTRRNRNMIESAFATLGVIYHLTVYNIRKSHRNALIGLLLTMAQSWLFILGFLGVMLFMGQRSSPIRGDYILFIMSGVFMFMVNAQTVQAVSSGGNALDAMNKHAPLNTAVMISASALAVLYRQVISITVLLVGYDMIFRPIQIEDPLGALAMLILSWFNGCAVGLVFLSVRAIFPQGNKLLSTIYRRFNMVASGKMFVGNLIPSMLLHIFAINPLFHIIDQTRGFIFINYSPRNSNIAYPVYFSLAVLTIGLMAEFVTRNSASISKRAVQ